MCKRKNMILQLLAVVFVMSSGCVIQSVMPFYTEETVVEIAELNGKWVPLELLGDDVSHEDIEPWVFNDDEIHTFDKNGRRGVLSVTYFKVEEKYERLRKHSEATLFMDTAIDYDDYDEKFQLLADELNEFEKFHVFPIPLHCVCKLVLEDEHLTLTPLDGLWFEDLIDENKIQMPIIRISEGPDDRVFNAKPEEWIKFFKKYRNDEDAFDTEYSSVFKRFQNDENAEKTEKEQTKQEP